MRKRLAICLAVMLLLAACAPQEPPEPSTSQKQPSTTEPTMPSTTEPPAEAEEDWYASELEYTLSYEDHTCGSYYILNDREPIISIEAVPPATRVAVGVSVAAIAAGIAAFMMFSGGAVYHKHRVDEERDRKRRARRRRRYRLESMGISEEEFERELEKYKQRHDRKRR